MPGSGTPVAYRKPPCGSRVAGAPGQRGTFVTRAGAGDGRRRRLRERRVRQRCARADAGEERRAIDRNVGLALEAMAQVLDLGDDVVAAVIAGHEAAEIAAKIHPDDEGVARRETLRDTLERCVPPVYVGEEEHDAGLSAARYEDFDGAEPALVSCRRCALGLARKHQRGERHH